MSYVAQSDLEGMIPPEYLVQSLNDNGDEGSDVITWAKVAQAVQDKIDALLSVSYSVPLPAPYPPLIIQAAKELAASLCYKRRGKSGTENPWEAQSDAWEKRLEKIGRGEEPLMANQTIGGGAVISEDSKLFTATGGMMV